MYQNDNILWPEVKEITCLRFAGMTSDECRSKFDELQTIQGRLRHFSSCSTKGHAIDDTRNDDVHTELAYIVESDSCGRIIFVLHTADRSIL